MATKEEEGELMPKGNEKSEGAPEKVIDLRDSHTTVSAKVLVQVAEALKFLNKGESIELLTDSYTGLRHDVQAWGRISGNGVHQKFDSKLESKYDHFIVTKGPKRHDPKERMAVIVCKHALDELISPLGFALSAAAAGMEVNIFFQGPGVHVLEKGFLGRMPGLMSPFSVFARRGMAAVGHDPPPEKLRQLHDLGAKFFVCHPSMEHFGVKEKNLVFDDVILAEYTTFLDVMRGASIQMYP